MYTTQMTMVDDTPVRTVRPEVARQLLHTRFARHELRVLRPGGTIDFVLQQSRLHDVGFHLVGYGSDVEIFTTGWRDFYLLQLTLSGVCELASSQTCPVTLGPGSLYVVNPGTTYRKRWSDDARQLIVRIPRRWVERIASPDTASQPVLFTPDVASQAGDDVVPLLQFLWAGSTASRYAPRSSVIDHSAARHLVTTVLHTLPNSATRPDDDGPPSCLVYADRYMRAHLADDFPIDQVADACGISSRTLQDAFKRHWRTTPTEHLRNLRLEAARQQLTEHPFATSVTEAAHAIGMSHLGRFSRYYRSRFGELPSASLRRAREAFDPLEKS